MTPATPAHGALAALIVHLRERHDLPTWSSVARRLGVHRSEITHLRRGAALSLDRVQRWCAAEGLTLTVHPDGDAEVSDGSRPE